MAFTTTNKNNRLTDTNKLEVARKVTKAFGGCSISENVGGWLDDSGKSYIEYSYNITVITGKPTNSLKKFFTRLAKKGQQKSYILNDTFIETGL